MDKAPYFKAISGAKNGPDICVFRKAADGVNLRLAAWTGGSKGTILLLNGRTEFIEKYGVPIDRLIGYGFSVVSLDWRGQGLSARLLDNPLLGHVDHFLDYQLDLDEALALVDDFNMPKIQGTICTSMGAAIALRGHFVGKPLGRMVFFAPMFDICLKNLPKHVAKRVSRTLIRMGVNIGPCPAPTVELRNVSMIEPFEGNELTSDPIAYEFRKKQYEKKPELEVGGPTLNWVHQAFSQTEAFRKEAELSSPSLIFVGDQEMIVSRKAIRSYHDKWANSQLIELSGARHELMIEAPEIQTKIWPKVETFFGV